MRVATRYAADRALFDTAMQVYDSLPDDIRGEVDWFLQGVYADQAQKLEKYADELYDLYEPVRSVLRSKYGNEILLYRGEPTDKPLIVRRFLSWTTSYSVAAEFARRRGFQVVEADVRVSDVTAVLFSPHNSRYNEYLVKDRKQYHERGTPLPWLGGLSESYPGPWTSILDLEAFTAWSDEVTRDMKTVIERAGGKVLTVNVDQDDQYVSMGVQLPWTVPVDDHRAVIGPYVVEGLHPGLP